MAKSAPVKSKQKNTKSTTPNEKIEQLDSFSEASENEFLTTNQGLKINDDQNSLKAGSRGPTLLEDFHLREKITHFDHERIPERIVHARGSAAHGFFQVYESLAPYTRAKFLQNPSAKTPVFVRFSTVAGSRGSTDLARDVRGFAVKFYTEEGNYDLVGNNMPVFFIQDALKFPDLIHAVKPEPHHEMPQAASAHDTFWDFISLMPESAHMIMWVMSDRAIPRSYRMMEGFGVHTFRLVNERGISRFVKFHWKPLLGVHSVTWDEAQKISGKDPDFHRRDLWEAIENGDFPEWELGLQIVNEADEHKFDFDLLDPTKLIPEEIVPVQRVGKLTLNRNPDNFFAETEQVAFHPGHLVPGIDLTNDPLLQGRLFSYTDTQLSRLGGPNFHEIPINRPVSPMHNNQRDGLMRQTINKGEANYQPNTIGGGCPMQAGKNMGAFISHAEKIDAHKIRERSPSFFDHYSQAALFFRSQSDVEKNHIIDALRFELSKVERTGIRERMLCHLFQIDMDLGKKVAMKLGIAIPPKMKDHLNQGMPADANPKDYQSIPKKNSGDSPSLSMLRKPIKSAHTRKVAFLVADGFDEADVAALNKALINAGAQAKLVAPKLGEIKSSKGSSLFADFTLFNTASVLFDAVYIPGGAASVAALQADEKAIHFVNESYQHCKTVGASGEGLDLIDSSAIRKSPDEDLEEAGLVLDEKGGSTYAERFVNALIEERHWAREKKKVIPA